MTLRADFARMRPDFPLLAPGDARGLERFLSRRGWLEPGESVVRCDRAGEGNMNLTLRVETERRSFILKQARPWVEKYDEIAAPLERAHFERRFYEYVRRLPGVTDRMPALLHADPDACVVVLEDVVGSPGGAVDEDGTRARGADLTSIYSGDAPKDAELEALAGYLATLHEGTRFAAGAAGGRSAESDASAFENLEMRALNHEHLFVVPLAEDNGLLLDDHAPGLADAAAELRNDADYRKLVRETSARYLVRADGFDERSCLLHGDFFPGSWLRTRNGLRIIDPEFSFPGDPEVDLGCALAHFALAGQQQSARTLQARYEADGLRPLHTVRLARYAAVEVMRRLIGVAQLPLPEDRSGVRAALLRRSRRAMLAGDAGALFE